MAKTKPRTAGAICKNKTHSPKNLSDGGRPTKFTALSTAVSTGHAFHMARKQTEIQHAMHGYGSERHAALEWLLTM